MSPAKMRTSCMFNVKYAARGTSAGGIYIIKNQSKNVLCLFLPLFKLNKVQCKPHATGYCFGHRESYPCVFKT